MTVSGRMLDAVSTQGLRIGGGWSGGVGREYGLSWKRRAIGHNVREFIFIVLAPVAVPVD